MLNENYQEHDDYNTAERDAYVIGVRLLLLILAWLVCGTLCVRSNFWSCGTEKILDIPEGSIVWQGGDIEEVAEQWVQICGVHGFFCEILSEGRTVG